MWERVAASTIRAYGGTRTAAGRGAVSLIELMQHRGTPLPLAVPTRTPGAGVGLFASRPVEAGEVVLTVPYELWQPHSAGSALAGARVGAPAFVERMESLDRSLRIRRSSSGDGAGGCGVGGAASKSLAELAALAMQVLFRAVPGADGAYVEWLHASQPLETVADAMPQFWPSRRLRELQASPLAVGAGEEGGGGGAEEEEGGGARTAPLGRLPALARTLHGAMFGPSVAAAAAAGGGSAPLPPAGVPVEAVLWALCLVQSRATSGGGGGGGGSGGGGAPFPFTLVPYFDLLNHDALAPDAPNCTHAFDPGTQAFTVTAARAIPAGTECLISYGVGLSGAELLRLYGFAPELGAGEACGGSGGSGGEGGSEDGGGGSPFDAVSLQLDPAAQRRVIDPAP